MRSQMGGWGVKEIKGSDPDKLELVVSDLRASY